MPDIDKAIKGLRQCAKLQDEPRSGACLDCPYVDPSIKTCVSSKPLLDDAAELMNELAVQLRIRILEPDEVEDLEEDEPVWLERKSDLWKTPRAGWAMFREKVFEDKFPGHGEDWLYTFGDLHKPCLFPLSLNEYGMTWRCWNRKPTDEQREEAAWDAID